MKRLKQFWCRLTTAWNLIFSVDGPNWLLVYKEDPNKDGITYEWDDDIDYELMKKMSYNMYNSVMYDKDFSPEQGGSTATK